MYVFAALTFVSIICSANCDLFMLIKHTNSTHYSQTCMERTEVGEIDWALAIAPKHLENYITLQSSYDNAVYIQKFDNSDKLALDTISKSIYYILPRVVDKRWEDFETITIDPSLKSVIPINASNLDIIHISLLFKDTVKVVLNVDGGIWCGIISVNTSIVYFNQNKCGEAVNGESVNNTQDVYQVWRHYSIYKENRRYILEESYRIKKSQLQSFTIQDIAVFSSSKAFIKLHQYNVLLLMKTKSQLFSSAITVPKEQNYSYISMYVYAQETCNLVISVTEHNNDTNVFGRQTFIGRDEWGVVHLNLNNTKQFNIQVMKKGVCTFSIIDDIRFSKINESRSFEFSSFKEEAACVCFRNNSMLSYTDPYPVLLPNKFSNTQFDVMNKFEMICLLEEKCFCALGYLGPFCSKDVSDFVSVVSTNTDSVKIQMKDIGYYNWSNVILEIINDDQSQPYNISTQAKNDIYQVNNLSAGTDYMLKARYCSQEGCTGFQNVPSNFKTKYFEVGKVQNCQIRNITATGAIIYFDRPIAPKGIISGYKIIYFPFKHISCVNLTNSTEIVKNITDHTLVLTNLEPFMDYNVEISAVNDNGYGEKIHINFQTKALDNMTYPESNTFSNTSPESILPQCEVVKGPIYYHIVAHCNGPHCIPKYKEISFEYSERQLYDDFIKKLQPFTQHKFDVVSSRYKDRSKLEFTKHIVTPPGKPNHVQELCSYAYHLNTTSVRWKPPYPPTGKIECYYIDYCLDGDCNRQLLDPNSTECTLWDDHLCADIKNLKADRFYKIYVAAKNYNYFELSDKQLITTFTNETAPERPTELGLLDKQWCAVHLSWHHPDKTNGLLKNFVVSVFQTTNQITNTTPHRILKYPVNVPSKVYNFTVKLDCLGAYQIYIQAENTYFLSERSNILSVDLVNWRSAVTVFGVSLVLICVIAVGMYVIFKKPSSCQNPVPDKIDYDDQAMICCMDLSNLPPRLSQSDNNTDKQSTAQDTGVIEGDATNKPIDNPEEMSLLHSDSPRQSACKIGKRSTDLNTSVHDNITTSNFTSSICPSELVNDNGSSRQIQQESNNDTSSSGSDMSWSLIQKTGNPLETATQGMQLPLTTLIIIDGENKLRFHISKFDHQNSAATQSSVGVPCNDSLQTDNLITNMDGSDMLNQLLSVMGNLGIKSDESAVTQVAPRTRNTMYDASRADHFIDHIPATNSASREQENSLVLSKPKQVSSPSGSSVVQKPKPFELSAGKNNPSTSIGHKSHLYQNPITSNLTMDYPNASNVTPVHKCTEQNCDRRFPTSKALKRHSQTHTHKTTQSRKLYRKKRILKNKKEPLQPPQASAYSQQHS